ncbi:MAG: hypothetical protein OXH93_19605 [Caldilineaceae bacterium]|nr:hypothetical protein [Caldilineaceae bacterium]
MTGNAGGGCAGSQSRAADRAGATDSCGGGVGDGVRGGASGALSLSG